MNEAEAASARADLEALRALQADAPELERIENLLDRFNAYEAIGFVGQDFSRTFLGKEMYEPTANLDMELRGRWAEFLDQDLPRIEAALKKETWIWESV